jgi:muramoyltetrapeptide carboxypeptidase LdcA involved in peptidoglycan recycling
MIEPSEEKPGPGQVARILRSFGALGVFDRLAGVLVGRARDHDAAETAALEAALLEVVSGELGKTSLPIVANLPFGHTDPQWVLPLGVRADLDLGARSLTLVEPWLS